MLKDILGIIDKVLGLVSGSRSAPKKPQKTLNLDGGLWGDRYRIGDKFRNENGGYRDDDDDQEPR